MTAKKFTCGYVAFLGYPNAGKSTLLNSILKEKIAAVTDKPQTTRKRLLGIYNDNDSQIIFIDTPGFHNSAKKLNQFLLSELDEAVKDADLIGVVFSPDQNPQEPLIAYAHEQHQKLKDKKWVMIVNKMDLPTYLDKKIKTEFPNIPVVTVSALKEEGMDQLIKIMKEKLPDGPALYDTESLTTASYRDLAAEIIREKATQHTFEEIPYALAVVIESYKEEREKISITAVLVVERESQKGMVIGKGAALIKKIGTEARLEISKLTGEKVFLDLRVKVDHNWTKDAKKLKKYGYETSRSP
ncbi:GTPase Era [bacterium]|nr:GTPase Era [bacterium]